MYELGDDRVWWLAPVFSKALGAQPRCICFSYSRCSKRESSSTNWIWLPRNFTLSFDSVLSSPFDLQPFFFGSLFLFFWCSSLLSFSLLVPTALEAVVAVSEFQLLVFC